MKRIDLPGGYAQPICDAFIIQGATWNSAGVILYSWSGSNGLFQVPATGGEPQRVTSTNPARHRPTHTAVVPARIVGIFSFARDDQRRRRYHAENLRRLARFQRSQEGAG